MKVDACLFFMNHTSVNGFYICSLSHKLILNCLSQKTRTELDDAFDTIAEFMTQTTYQCKVCDYLPATLCSQQQNPED